jgi:glucose/arabinose dehydrogenase
MVKLGKVISVALCCIGLSGCYAFRPSEGGAKLTNLPEGAQRRVVPADVAVPAGYRIEAVATGLTFPTGVAFDKNGIPYVVESGYSYGEVWTVPRLLRVERGGNLIPVATGGKNGPWTGVVTEGGNFYVAEGGELEGGRILKVTADGRITPLVENLPTRGDHHTNGPVVGPDGWLYFGLGTATNSAVVGEDNYHFGWLKRYPDFHDTACQDVTLLGENYQSKDVVKGSGEVSTGAFKPFGTPSTPGEVIRGKVPCNGAVMKISPTGGAPQLVAWGFRNPFGLAWSPDGRLYVTDNGYDTRGSRPVFGTGDPLWEVTQGTWYGWPDFSGGLRLDLGNQFKEEFHAKPKLLLVKYPNVPPKPTAVLPVHASADGFDFSRSDAFGHRGEAFIALFGDQSPGTGKLLAPVGFKVVRVDVKSGVIEEFAANKGKKNGPASAFGTGGFERPVAARFDPSGKALYVVDFGILKETGKGSVPVQKTGVLWRITREGTK